MKRAAMSATGICQQLDLYAADSILRVLDNRLLKHFAFTQRP